MKNALAKLQAKATIKAMDAKEGLENFITSEASVKGTSEEGTNTYGGQVGALIFIGLVVFTLKVVVPAVMDGWQKGTTKFPANWV
ncbi:hypothetical protein QK289_15495 [Exiguobacterium antarcticum]|uniref:Uncharacterized protein n=1 Tax=Exiguobacterium antarcticum TaxID=132920 RepID=A0ABT6R637_9BACL|nr:hypothetical protein [Exiguobacterium antarcticum]MDI3236418.1 hypothetical protein [Exiguobacterium antarcticum]MDI3236419.1 hypothetical protein [Exiguobacterium antarcticum]